MNRRAILQAALATSIFAASTWSGRGQSMVFPGETWERATPQSQGVSDAKLRDAVSYLESVAGGDGVNELVIIRNGRMIWRGKDSDKVHGVWSCTKSFTSTVLGLLVDDGKCEVDDKAARWLPGLAQSYPEVTLRHFATMTSGYRAKGDEPRGGYRHGPSATPFEPDPTPLFSPPGSTYAYWDSAMNQFGNVITRIAGEPMEVVFRRRIAEPIGMNERGWRWGDFGEIDGVVVNGGSGNSDRHVFINADELARFGHLMLGGGNWNGKQLLSSKWIDLATRPNVPAEGIELHPDSGADGRGVYGLNWWTNGTRPDGKRLWPGVPDDTFAASGYNNNDMFVIPAWRMVVVRLGLDQGDKLIADEEYAEFLRRLDTAIGAE